MVRWGRYCESISFCGKAIQVASHFIFDADTATINSTIIEGDDSTATVSFCSNEGLGSLIRGFTITHAATTSGRGIYCTYSSPTIRQNVITNNRIVDGGGGAICCNRLASPVIADNEVLANYAQLGGAIYCLDRSSPSISGNAVRGNSAGAGGGIYCSDMSSPFIENNAISGNYAIQIGGGVHCQLGSAPNIINNVIAGDSAGYYGGGVACWDVSTATPTIVNNEITGNMAKQAGGGIYCHTASPLIDNNVLRANFAGYYGAGVLCDLWSSPVIQGNTMIGNRAGNRGGGVSCMSTSRTPIVRDNIISRSMAGGGIACEDGSNPTIRHNDVWANADGDFHNCPPGVGDTSWGTNVNGEPCDSFFNVSCPPLFCFPDTGDYHLAENSCCVGAGEGGVDIGAFGVGCPAYVLGDVNRDGLIDIVDLVDLIGYLYRAAPAPNALPAGDTNYDGEVNLADIVCLLNHVFRGGSLPC